MRDYGGFLRGERKHRGLRQIDLAKGICSVDTISRIENGSQVPSAAIFSMCMERLGVSGFSYGDFFDSESVRMYELRGLIRLGFSMDNLEMVLEALGEYGEMLKEDDVWDRQFYEFARARYLYAVGESGAKCLEIYKKSANMSLTDLNGRRDFAGRALTRTEAAILSEIGIVEHDMGNPKSAIMIYNRLLIHLNRYTSRDEIKGDFYGMLLSNTAMCERGIYDEEAVRHINKAKAIAVDHCNLNVLFRILYNSNIILGYDDVNIPGGVLNRNYSVCREWLKYRKTYDDFSNDDVFLHLM